ncbi:hypothetical protein [Mesorhizobium sp. M0276]|uniref:hypothetical protein n=1 Tax=Mesorhizobium sp. M0276 TaxID=2956928 RepID=UPI00333D4C7C
MAAAGHQVTVLDIDPQLSALEWSKNTRRAGYALSNIDVIRIRSTEVLIDRLAQSDAEDLLLVDVQGGRGAGRRQRRLRADPDEARLRSHAMPVSQMIELQVHCARNRTPMQEVVQGPITEFLARQPK